MGTRGFTGWVIKDQPTLSYQQFDSYPSGVGIRVLGFLRDEDPNLLFAKLDRCRKVDEQEQVTTAEDAARYAQYSDTSVSTGDDWYSVLRKLQGDLAAMVEARIVCTIGEEWAYDSLFCEWGYLINIDTMEFEVYRGFQQVPPTAGRWTGRTNVESSSATYYPVNRVAAWPLHALPTDAEFLAVDGEEE